MLHPLKANINGEIMLAIEATEFLNSSSFISSQTVFFEVA
jgi:hypothetical protein